MKQKWRKNFKEQVTKLDSHFPKLGRELTKEDLVTMQTGSPFYVYTPSNGISLRIKQAVDGENLICFNERGRMRYILKNCGETYAVFDAILKPTSYQKQLFFTVVGSDSSPQELSVQAYDNEEKAISSCHINAKTVAKMCENMGYSPVTLRLNQDSAQVTKPDGGKYFWKVIEGSIL